MSSKLSQISQQILEIANKTLSEAQGIDVIERQTKPKPLYTEGSLIEDMKNIGQYVDDDDQKKVLKDNIGIRTEATRANIIETLKRRDFLTIEKKNIISTAKGRQLIYLLESNEETKCLTDAVSTAVWESKLSDIEEGKNTPKNFLTEIRYFISSCVSSIKSKDSIDWSIFAQKSIGTCPECKGKVVENKLNYSCEHNNYKDNKTCQFVVWKEYPFLFDKITTCRMVKLLQGEAIKLKARKKNGAGQYTALFKLNKRHYQGKLYFSPSFDSFVKQKSTTNYRSKRRA